MMNEKYPSQLLEAAVNEFSRLPGVGRKTAFRFVLYILSRPMEDVKDFAGAILKLKEEIKYCKKCHNISDSELCSICSDSNREEKVVCVVENISEVMAVENTGQFNGLYHVLGGLVSPMDGIGPSDLQIESLIERIGEEDIKEIILALPATMEGDTTSFYIYKKLSRKNIKITTIARGISVGDELEYTDEVTLGRSIVNRITYNG